MDNVDEEADPFTVKQLVNLDSYLEKNMCSEPTIQNETKQNETKRSKDIMKGVNSQRSKKYLEYTPASKELLFHYKIQHLMSVAAASRKAEVKESTARTWWKKFQGDPDSFTLEKKTNTQNRPKNKLQTVHKQSLIEFFDNEPNAYIHEAVEMFTSKFAGLEIKKSRVHEFMRDECNLSLKRATRWPEARANEDNVQKRYEWVIR
jgi:transposase